MDGKTLKLPSISSIWHVGHEIEKLAIPCVDIENRRKSFDHFNNKKKGTGGLYIFVIVTGTVLSNSDIVSTNDTHNKVNKSRTVLIK